MPAKLKFILELFAFLLKYIYNFVFRTCKNILQPPRNIKVSFVFNTIVLFLPQTFFEKDKL